MRKQAALGQLDLLRKYPYRQTLIANLTDEAQRTGDNGTPGLFTLGLALTYLAPRGPPITLILSLPVRTSQSAGFR